jgi:hypothetical protein
MDRGDKQVPMSQLNKAYVYNPRNSREFPWGKWLKEMETGVKWLKEVGNRCKMA